MYVAMVEFKELAGGLFRPLVENAAYIIGSRNKPRGPFCLL